MASKPSDTGAQHSRRANAVQTMRGLLGPEFDPDKATRALVNRNGALGSFGADHVLGNLWSRPQLSRRDRSIVVLSFLAVLGVMEEFEVHVRAGLNHGLGREQIEELVVQIAAYAGFPLAMQANRSVNKVWSELDG
ncbi:MAG: carboxymuconolactone decarboxylase family protein, partial [Gammaproteobacteria bacterium]|nr:carboxymuconolactone decarboxylase family protein [Gammaproteobacteria bacterium]